MSRLAVDALVILGLLAAACAYVTQPVLSSGGMTGRSGADPVRLETHVRALAERFSPRGDRNLRNLDAAAGYIADMLRAAGGQVSDQPYSSDGHTYRNVIAAFGPQSEEQVVIGAHYDTFLGFPGADDNASGVAGVLELARLLGAGTPRVRVELVAYSLEEPPHFRTESMGSAVHAASLMAKNARVRAMISLEMIGCFSDERGSQRFPLGLLQLLYPSTGNFIAVVGRIGGGSLVRTVKKAMRGATPLPVRSVNAPGFIPGIDFSDHLAYWNQGYPALMVTDTAFYRNPRYHTADDLPDTLDYRRMALVVDGLAAAVRALAAD